MTLLTLSTTAADALAASIVQGLLLVLAVALCLRLVPRISAAARSLIWTAVFTLILALPFFPTRATSGPAHTLSVNPFWTIALAALWLTASLIRATQLLLGAFALRRLARSATPVPNQLSDAFTLCTSPHVDRPSVVGFFSRRILLPPELYASLTPAELHHVLLHETEHLRRRDDWTNLLQKLALVLVPLNPVLLWVERRLCLERELACDDRVLRATGAPKAYATCLTHLAEHSLLRRGLTLALGFLGSIGLFNRQSELTRRVHRILRAPQQAMSPRQTAAATATVLVALAGSTLTLARSPQLVRFTAPQPFETAAHESLPATAGRTAFQPVAFRTSDAGARPILLKAVLPAPAKPRPINRVKRTAPRQPSRPGVVRALQAGWTADAPPQRLVLTTASGTQVSYTFLSTVAVATPHGWIVFQL